MVMIMKFPPTVIDLFDVKRSDVPSDADCDNASAMLEDDNHHKHLQPVCDISGSKMLDISKYVLN